MFEGPIQASSVAGQDEPPILRQLRWTDLVARLAATREQRGPAAASAPENLAASFAAFHRVPGNDDHPAVNRDALACGKLTRLSSPDAADAAGTGDRET